MMDYGSTLLPERFWAKVEIGPDGFHSQTGENLGPCWLWKASNNPQGYGMFRVGSRTTGTRTQMLAHRLTWLVEHVTEDIERLIESRTAFEELDHLCRSRACCNPSHLEPVSHDENCKRGDKTCIAAASRKRHEERRSQVTHCPKGHAYAEHGIVHLPKYPNSRRCRLCRIEYLRAYRRRARTS